ncbi:MAG: zinc ribbon domain-containing protein [Candidatus Latescibacteria bacterium]|nr:zinc ribbon domain-containing protein [Candidatus Latescibacterota bacterium]
MPTYEYVCLKCEKPFVITESLTEHGTHKVRCPNCKSAVVERTFSSVFAITEKKS